MRNLDESKEILWEFVTAIKRLTVEKFETCLTIERKVATFLHPNYKRFLFIRDENLRNTEIEAVKTHINEKISMYEAESDCVLIPAKRSKEAVVVDSDCEIDDESGDEEPMSELDVYAKEKVMRKIDDPLSYWKDSRLKHMKKIAYEVFSLPASSSNSKRVFSYNRKILRKDRCSLKPQTLNMLTVLTSNCKNNTTSFQ